MVALVRVTLASLEARTAAPPKETTVGKTNTGSAVVETKVSA